MRAARRLVALGLALLVLALPLAPAQANDGETSDSRAGVLLAAVCGFALKSSLIAPVPWAGIAAVSCLMGFIDAALSPDDPAPPPPSTPPPTP